MVRKPKVAITHDWLVSPGGGEKVLYQLHKMWPDAPIYTAAFEPSKFPEFSAADIRPTWLNHFSLAKKKHQLFAIPRIIAFRGLNLKRFDIVISSSTAEGKLARTGKSTLHICYCNTPTRYYWSDYEWYLKHPPFSGTLKPVSVLLLRVLAPLLRKIDYNGAQRVDCFIANSNNIRARIKKYYDRDSTVIYPPVATDKFLKPRREGDYYLVVGRQVAYKRLDLAVAAFNELGLPLKVAGEGEDIEVQRERSSSNISFLGRVSDSELAELYSGARALIHPQEEDFGITQVEAMAAGCPVIAYAKGGAAEVILDQKTGLLFNDQTPKSLIGAVKKFQTLRLDEKVIRLRAKKFDESVFRKDMQEFVDQAWHDYANKK